MTDQPPGIPAVQMAYPDPQWQSGRWIDPVRAAALHEAVDAYGTIEEDVSLDAAATQIIYIAERFEAWLAGPEAE
jgi:hypothetical protein